MPSRRYLARVATTALWPPRGSHAQRLPPRSSITTPFTHDCITPAQVPHNERRTALLLSPSRSPPTLRLSPLVAPVSAHHPLAASRPAPPPLDLTLAHRPARLPRPPRTRPCFQHVHHPDRVPISCPNVTLRFPARPAAALPSSDPPTDVRPDGRETTQHAHAVADHDSRPQSSKLCGAPPLVPLRAADRGCPHKHTSCNIRCSATDRDARPASCPSPGSGPGPGAPECAAHHNIIIRTPEKIAAKAPPMPCPGPRESSARYTQLIVLLLRQRQFESRQLSLPQPFFRVSGRSLGRVLRQAPARDTLPRFESRPSTSAAPAPTARSDPRGLSPRAGPAPAGRTRVGVWSLAWRGRTAVIITARSTRSGCVSPRARSAPPRLRITVWSREAHSATPRHRRNAPTRNVLGFLLTLSRELELGERAVASSSAAVRFAQYTRRARDRRLPTRARGGPALSSQLAADAARAARGRPRVVPTPRCRIDESHLSEPASERFRTRR